MTLDLLDEQWAGLSNLALVTVQLDGESYPSVEHAYQAAKTTDERFRFFVRTAITPELAARLGRQVDLRPDWEAVRDGILVDLLRQKYTIEPYRGLLAATEDNDLGDDRLGRMLMSVRSEMLVAS